MKFLKSFLAFFALGLLSVVSLVPTLGPLVEKQIQTMPELSAIPEQVLVLLSLLNPLILITLSIILGILLAPKLGLTSYLHERITQNKPYFRRLKQHLTFGILLGLLVAVMNFILDMFIFRPLVPAALRVTSESRGLLETVSGVLYGGIGEELMIRWGLMTVIIWMLWKVFQRKRAVPGNSLFWIGIVVSAVLFAFGHLGATMALAPITPAVFFRMILLNGIGGIVFGWLFWKKGLETAMVAHAVVHIATSVLVWAWFSL